MAILLVWELLPEETSFHLLPYQEKWMQLHGRFINAEGTTPAMVELIEELDKIKGPPVPSNQVEGVTHFLQTGVVL
jgi:hypothetical protein